MKKNYYSKTKISDQTLKKSNKSVFLFFLMLVLGFAHTYAQNVNIPDSNFEQTLVTQGIDTDGVVNGLISSADAENVIGALGLHQKGITDLTGIAAFINVTELTISNNDLIGTLDLSGNTALEWVQAYNNELTGVDVTGLEVLYHLDLANQKETTSGGSGQREVPSNLIRDGIADIDLSTNTALEFLHVGQNALTSLDVSKNTKLTSVQAGNNKLTSFDASTLNEGGDDGNGNPIGIQRLDLKFNELITLNLANGLNAVDDNSGDLNPNFLGTSFHLQGSSNRGIPDPHNNELVCIQFDDNLNLESLPTTGIVFITDNNGVGLFGSFTFLTYKGTTIFSNGPCEFDIPDTVFEAMLTTATGDDVVIDGVGAVVNREGNAVKGQGVDTDGNGEISYEEAVSFTGTLQLGDLRPRIESLAGIEAFINLTGLRVFGNALTVLDMSKNVNLVHFNASGQSDGDGNKTLLAINLANGNNVNMASGTGVSGFWNFGNPNLSCIFVDADFYDGTDSDNDLSKWSAYDDDTEFCKNYLMIDNFTPGTYDTDVEALLKPIDANFHRRLLNHHINRDFGSSDYVSGGNGGHGAGIAEEINIHFVGEDEAEYVSPTVDGNAKLDPATVISYYEAVAFTGKLWLDGEKIIFDNALSSAYRTILDFNGDDTDDTGLETFVNITELDMSNNFDIEEESLNLETLTKLTELNLASCNFGSIVGRVDLHETITTLDLSRHTALEKLYLSVNDLTSIDVSALVNLKELNVSDNRLRELDVSDNTALTNLYLSINDIEVLDVTNNPNLTALNFSRNFIASIDLSNQPDLEVLRSEFNFLTSLDVSNNIKLTELSLYRNELELLNIANGENQELTSLYFSQTDDADYTLRTGGYGNYEDGIRPHGDDDYSDDERVNADNSRLIINGDNEASCILVDDAEYSDTNWAPSLNSGYKFVDLKDFTTNYTAVLVNGQYTLTPADVYIYDCLNVDLSFSSGSQTEFTCADAGTFVDVSLIVTYGDETYEETATVAVSAGSTDATAIAQDITVTLAGNGQYTLVPNEIDNGSGVGCSAGNVTLSFENLGSEITFTCDDIGENTVTLVATDANNVTSSADAIVTVVENNDLAAFAKDFTVVLDANGFGFITTEDIDDGSGVGCSAGNITLSLDRSNFSMDDIGTPVTVTLTATDLDTNTFAIATAQVTVVAFDPDNPDPEEDNSIAAKGFSPNGDGIGDTWVIENIRDYPNNTVQVFNQWGVAVFQASGYQNDFEGISNKTGSGLKRLPAGPYLYIINFNDAAMAPERGWVYINY